MITKKQIKDNWKKQHDILSAAYYAGKTGLTKAEFDSQHGAIWEMSESELIEAGYKEIPQPARDTLSELDELLARVVNLESLNKPAL